jgi:hypothetical protein
MMVNVFRNDGVDKDKTYHVPLSGSVHRLGFLIAAANWFIWFAHIVEALRWSACLAYWLFFSLKWARDSLGDPQMSNEELERRMAFIVEQQAQFATDIQQLRESQTQTDQVVAQSGEIVARLANVTLEGFKDVNGKINALVDSQIRTEENLSRTEENLSRTDENLRKLIAVVDRYFSEGRNGR